MLVNLQWNTQAYLDTIKNNNIPIEVSRFEVVDSGLEFVGDYICLDGERIPLTFMVVKLFDGCYGNDGSFANFITSYSDNPVLNWPGENYGSADTIEQIVKHHANLIADPLKKYVLSVTLLLRDVDKSWRWHKNGQYIGTRQPQAEHLGDEPEITEVIMYEFIEVGDPE